MPAGVGYPEQKSPLGAAAAQQQAMAPKVMPTAGTMAMNPYTIAGVKPPSGGIDPNLHNVAYGQNGGIAAAPGATNVPSPAMTQNAPNQGGNPLVPQPQGSPQGSYQQDPSAYNDYLTALFNASSGIDTTQLDQTLASIQGYGTRTAASQASNTASQALGAGAAGTPVAQMANDAVGAALAQSQMMQNQTTLDYLLGRSGQNIQGLSSGTGLALSGENQAFNQQLASQQQNLNALGMLMDAGALPRNLEQANMQAQYAEWLRLQGLDDAAIAQLTGLAGGTPFFQNTPVIPPNYGAAAINGLSAGIGAYGALSNTPMSPSPQVPGANFAGEVQAPLP